MNFLKALTTLEFDKVLTLLSQCAHTDGAKALALSVTPTDDPDKVKKQLSLTTYAKEMLLIKGVPPFGNVRDITESSERAQKGAMLTLRELLDVANVLRTSRSLVAYSLENNGFDFSMAVQLNEIFKRLTSNKHLEDRIYKSIISEDTVADEASPELADIRRKIRNVNNKIKDSLQKFVTGTSKSKYLQENIVTMRNGRYVVPVKNEYKNEIPGLVHDTSSSGATVFVEPLSVVQANNELRELELKEAKEIEKILYELSGLVGDISDALVKNYHNITVLALIFAKAELSVKMKACAPHISDRCVVDLKCARHPLLKDETVVPIDVNLGDSFDTLVITGPNTGGKTVTLKTIGLFVMMAQSGLHIPAGEESSVGIFEKILVDIGDEQSIEQSLSTFSSHMVNIVKIIKLINDKTLVLFDELGAGTDPVEGAALAMSILEHVRTKGSLCAATTHYAELKAFALETKGVCNASCEFDLNTLKPTYKLIIGLPGKSNAFAISSKLGLDESIVEHAKTLVDSDNRKFEGIIEKIEENRIKMQSNLDESEKLRREFEAYKSAEEEKIKKKIDDTEKELERAREQASRMVQSAKSTSEFVLAELEKVKKERESDRLASELDRARDSIRRKLRSTADETDPIIDRRPSDYVLPRELKVGDEVLLVNLDTKATVLSVPDKDGNLNVQAGIIKTKTNIKNLILLDESKTSITDKNKKKTSPKGFRNVKIVDFKPELDLRGLNGDDAWFMIDKYFDDAKVVGVRSVTLIHGKGTGALRKAVWANLKQDSRVVTFRQGLYGEGDSGVTIVELK